MDSRRIEPVRHALDAVVRAVPSKSVTHRALVAAALARGTSRVRSPLDAEDTRRTRDALRAVGVDVRVDLGQPCTHGSPATFQPPTVPRCPLESLAPSKPSRKSTGGCRFPRPSA